MEIIVSAIVLLIGIYTFFTDRTRKMEVLLFSTLCLNFASFSFVSFGTAAKIVCVFFFLSEIRHAKEITHTLKETPLFKLLIFISVAAIIHIISSPHLNNPVSILGFIVNELIAKYFVIAYIFVFFQGKNELKRFVSISYFSLLLITFVGLVSLITHSDPMSIFTMSDAGEYFVNHKSRKRIISLFIYPFDYGYASLMLLLFMIYAYTKKLLCSKRLYIAIICSIFGILFCGCRTVLVTTIIAFSFFFFFRYSLMRFGWYIFGGLLIIIGAYNLSPKFEKTIDITFTAFDPDAKMEKGGSSTLKDRSLQYFTAYTYARKNIWLGRGYRFFENDLGYNKNGNGMYSLKGKARNLLGLEGVLMRLILERGILGIAVYIIFYFVLFRYLAQLKRFAPIDVSFGIATLVAFICYGNMTGELGSAIITFFFMGIYLKSAQIIKTKKIKNRNPAAYSEYRLLSI